jgi:hypothetical protein
VDNFFREQLGAIQPELSLVLQKYICLENGLTEMTMGGASGTLGKTDYSLDMLHPSDYLLFPYLALLILIISFSLIGLKLLITSCAETTYHCFNELKKKASKVGKGGCMLDV